MNGCAKSASIIQRIQTFGIYDETGYKFSHNCNTDKGISIGSPLSPLLGAIALKPLDDAMEKLPVFYVRYVDDWCILAKSKYKLRRAIKKIHRVLEQLQLKTHPDKTFIGRREKGFSFLGFQLGNNELKIAEASIKNYQAKRLQLQEQQAPHRRLVDYSRRWLRWFTSGVRLSEGYVAGVVDELQGIHGGDLALIGY